MKRLFLIAALLGCLIVSGCVTDPVSDRLTVAVSIVPEETFVKAVAGELVDVAVMIPPGSNPENYELTPLQRQKLEIAEVYFAIGVPAENGIMKLIPSNEQNRKLVFLNDAAREQYPELFLGTERDPHVWLSPKRVAVMVEKIADVLADADSVHADVYKSNAAAYIEKLDILDSEIADILKKSSSKMFIAYHPAFGYFADDYGLTQFALEEEGKEATIQHLTEMIDFARANNIKVVFYQDEIDTSQAKAFAEEINGNAVSLSPLSANYIENMKTIAQTIAEA